MVSCSIKWCGKNKKTSSYQKDGITFHRFPFIILLSALLCTPSYAQPVVSCQDDAQCPDGEYCATEAEYCVKCFSCEDFRRKPGPANKCIKTIGECGPCFDGLVADQTKECLPPIEESEGIPAYIWGIIVVILLIFVFLVAVVFIYLFRGNVLKISSRTLLRGPCPGGGASGELNLHASAPDPPPPYNPYSPLRPDSPPAPLPSDGMHDLHYADTRDEDQDTAGPFIKRAPSSHRPHQPRESDGSQNARVYNKPRYMRHRSPTPESKLDEDDNFSPIQDEDTTESTWTPAADSNNINGNASSNEMSVVRVARTVGAGGDAGSDSAAGESSSLPALLAAARDTTLLEPPAKKPKEHVNDNNNNGNTGAVANESNTNNNVSHQNAQAAAMYLNIQVNNYPRNVLHYN